jgi:hypothetical protein
MKKRIVASMSRQSCGSRMKTKAALSPAAAISPIASRCSQRLCVGRARPDIPETTPNRLTHNRPRCPYILTCKPQFEAFNSAQARGPRPHGDEIAPPPQRGTQPRTQAR